MFTISRNTVWKAFLLTAAAVVASVSIVLTLVPIMGGQPEGVGFWMSVLCPMVIGAPASLFQFHQNEKISLAHAELARMHGALAHAHQQLTNLHGDLRQRSRIDALTGGLNRETFLSALDDASSGARGYSSLLMADADHFKKINDEFGHPCGDEALRAIGRAISASLRPQDFWGRIGGEEFAIFLADADRETASDIADAVRAAVAGTELIEGERRVPLSISVGVAMAIGAADPMDMMRVADRNLYGAKRAGRDRVILEPGLLSA
ncbi:MAG: GGDEF domain-containing protein [Allorhizobium sp.]